MPAEYMGINGLCQGYFCYRCGKTVNMVGTGHGEGKCEPNPLLVAQLKNLNKGDSVAKFDHGGGCACGLYRTCQIGCANYVERAPTLVLRGPHVPANSIPQLQTLGQKLSATLDELDSAKVKGLQAKATADLDKIRKERAELDTLKNSTIKTITDQIQSGKVPYIKVTNYGRQSWIKEAMKGTASHQSVWDELKSWARSNALTIDVREDHDGGGIDSWLVITAVPVKPGTRGI